MISKLFAIRSLFGITLLALIVQFIHFPTLTDDTLLIAVFGGVFLGLGIGLAIRGGGVIDGTEVLAIFLDKRSNLTVGDIILLFNVVIFAFASYVFSLEIGMYGMLTYLVASKTVNSVTSGVHEYAGMEIISGLNSEIQSMLLDKFNIGCTLYAAKSGYEKSGIWKRYDDVISCIVSRLNIAQIQNEIDKIDPDALVIIQDIKELRGDFGVKNSSAKTGKK